MRVIIASWLSSNEKVSEMGSWIGTDASTGTEAAREAKGVDEVVVDDVDEVRRATAVDVGRLKISSMSSEQRHLKQGNFGLLLTILQVVTFDGIIQSFKSYRGQKVFLEKSSHLLQPYKKVKEKWKFVLNEHESKLEK